MVDPGVLEQIVRLKEDSFKEFDRSEFDRSGSTYQKFYGLLSLFPSLLKQYKRELYSIRLRRPDLSTTSARVLQRPLRYQTYVRFLHQLKQIKSNSRMSGPGYSTNGVTSYSHTMTPAGMRAAAAEAAREAAASIRLDAARANIREMEARAASRNAAAAREAAAREAAARNAAARNAVAREAAAREAAARNAAAREAEAAANKNKIRPPLNFWMRTNGVRVMLEDIKADTTYILLETNFENDNDDTYLVKKIGDVLYKIGKYTTDKNKKIVYERMVQEQVINTATLELYKFPDSLQSGGNRSTVKQRRNRRKSHTSRKSRKHH